MDRMRLGSKVVAVGGLLFLLTRGESHGLDFIFRREVGLPTIFQSFANIGRFNVVIAPSIRGRMNFELRDVSPEEAMRHVARINGFVVQRVETEGRPTYFIGHGDLLDRHPSARVVRFAHLRYQSARDLRPVLADLLAPYEVLVHGQEGRDLIALQGPPEAMERALDMVNYLDLPDPRLRIVLTVSRDGKQTWCTRLEARSGHPVRAVVGPEDAPGTSGLVYLTVELTPRLHPDRLIGLEAAIRLTPPSGLQRPDHVLSELRTSTRVPVDGTCELASLESPTGQILTFAVKIEALDPGPVRELVGLSSPVLPEIDLEDGAAFLSSPVPLPGEDPGGALGGDLGDDLRRGDLGCELGGDLGGDLGTGDLFCNPGDDLGGDLGADLDLDF